ncbi:protocatechuate 3,4-dioxygenase subunit alpha [Ponticoccus sp. SC2-23]|uniref:protocatechuate 3,4-dioxygenase subunit alpha n=1 Tax=Alexandriicola marinus TaxID=2081710 RepID=UPI000FD871F5|nr:protocatechuate 3,4-dioxygenase subunit alpha [Alexandriicola marinus]MBM1221798.1 protocatechuate 3,4-dioxygenase subunit alpha [Ponticoccus sp. SC6-9]MBM1226149.1 protocatechuate 3,4-dioxygenase subunit alpha [Ponticoccus sp. SC6-15]MBM1230745.1 protocatechuate 3,4-dioxygenase subunit alpha [Ponticoccus sp. SC6-38]MBM1235414.1 protocatechuate 3,4-dioxygenase subunit alpha [Ponticoccus sp. SC6-45]MBM1239767.1 protocatechuate 3,4-dioxygenase subunit alpha [Ponticoccus sp. SC6-49]MBM1243911
MTQPLDILTETPSQTAGPYVHIGCIPTFAGVEGVYPEDLGLSPISDGARGEVITIRGSVYDGTGWALRDAMMESWQPDAAGLFPGQDGADPKVSGFCRFAADKDSGEFTLRTVKPGPVPLRHGGLQAPHIALWIVARGINIGLSTRIYFEDEDNSGDMLLNRIEQRPRADTLIARKTGEGEYRFDIRLQGEGETVFLDM